MDVIRLPIADLIPDPANANSHPERNLQAIAASLKRFGQQKPIVVNDDGIVIAGNGTLEAAKRIGWTEIDCVRSNLSGAELIAFGIADNKTAQLAEWNYEELASLLKGLNQEADAELLAATGFADHEIQPMLAANWNPPKIDDAADEGDGDGGDGGGKKPDSDLHTLHFNADQWATLEQAIIAKRKQVDDQALSGSQVVMLILSDYLLSPDAG